MTYQQKKKDVTIIGIAVTRLDSTEEKMLMSTLGIF
jgi:hypothetical protein